MFDLLDAEQKAVRLKRAIKNASLLTALFAAGYVAHYFVCLLMH